MLLVNLGINVWYFLLTNFMILIFNYFTPLICLAIQVYGFYFYNK